MALTLLAKLPLVKGLVPGVDDKLLLQAGKSIDTSDITEDTAHRHHTRSNGATQNPPQDDAAALELAQVRGMCQFSFAKVTVNHEHAQTNWSVLGGRQRRLVQNAIVLLLLNRQLQRQPRNSLR
jgi:hypothetical protein